MSFETAGAAAVLTLPKPDFSQFIGASPSMQQLYKTISSLLDNDSTVLILGESGTGKELVAKAIHHNSTRLHKRMVTVNCGAIPEELLESELFGHEKGAFTGAIRDRVGKFQLADQGTIFLDEIGDMSPNLQVKLLRVLQEQEFERVGSAKLIKVNVRVIAATNQNLDEAVKKGRFREDLFYRLNVIPVELPPLRDRGDDIALLTGHFIKLFNRSLKRSILGISPEALNILNAHSWPGNIRELEHMIERLVVLKGKGVLEKADLPPKLREIETSEDAQISKDMLLVGDPEELADCGIDISSPAPDNSETLDQIEEIPPESSNQPAESHNAPPGWENTDVAPPILPEKGLDLKSAVDKYETALILAALTRCGWVKNKAARLLRLNRTTLVEKLKKRNILNGLKKDAAA